MLRGSDSVVLLEPPAAASSRVIVVNAKELGGDYVKKGVAYTSTNRDILCCKFCHIVAACSDEVLYDEEHISVFRPLHPASASHILVVPKHHLRNINHLTSAHLALLARMKDVARHVLAQLGYYRGRDADLHLAFHSPPFNSIDHVHMHAMVKTRKTALGCVKYKTGTWWCRSYSYVVNRLQSKRAASTTSSTNATATASASRPRARSFHGSTELTNHLQLCDSSHRKFGTYPSLDTQRLDPIESI
ncbi:hypothetical protein SDRG_11973 [Saprolegnia diclina VS20]|uniref:HIT domain-containing protein n=1 Tax=Saprolegnia diclina (strain VS20) TaxID=1156394 RepID=T0RDQ4_SAPDV|nr:hypothetical protein SDRG_11973 [Saprolegnia diclina VS20]EQC30398.1 hypothetical protein SDRG_11973 [Saprolegnia diclina VS20]|eukprot:XP_008616251.1 hypothetical protein SDRG_11973 [Saprolegnia diclina VS20]